MLGAYPKPVGKTVPVIVRLAKEADTPGFVELAGQVEHWFEPMVGEPAFGTALAKHIRRGTALVATTADETEILGGGGGGDLRRRPPRRLSERGPRLL